MRRVVYGLMAGLVLCTVGAMRAAGSSGWVEVRSPHFVVVSNAGDKEARKTAVQFEQIRAVFREALPARQADAGPVVTILAVKDDKSLQELLPDYWTKGHAHPAGLFVSAMNQFYIAVDLDAEGTNPYETIYHEYYHSQTAPYYPDMPTWLAEGLADFFGNSRIDGKTAIVGEASPELLYQLVHNRMIPLDTLFRVDRSSPYYNENSKVTMFYAESWALVHYLLVGDNQAHRAMLATYLAALDAGTKQDDAAAKAFGDLKKLQDNLETYIRRYAFYEVHYPAPAEFSEADLKVRSISEADVDAYKGGLSVARGRSQDAKTALEQAIQLDAKNARAYQNLAMTQYFLGDRADALASASKAISFDPQSMVARYLRAYLTFNDSPEARNPQIETDLRAAIGGDPDFAPPYGLLAVYMAGQEENLPEALGLAQKAISLEPGNAEFRLAAAQVLMRMRNFDAARSELLMAKQSAASSQQTLQAEMYLTALDDMEKDAKLAAEAAQSGGELRRRDALGIDRDPNSAEATGTVSDVSCAAGLKLQLQTASGTLTLRDVPGRGVKIESKEKIPENFTPCSLKGSR
ncbi:MAG TPA: tetratricopeptide repeat protein, partial [Candidatus Acidoferrales bacterium]|nr:tetratricopeptide repeat protein [Candidatus Acidoferrales bacterium]